MTTNKTISNSTLTDKVIGICSYFILHMGFAFVAKILANKVLYFFGLPIMSYWVALSAWLLLMMIVFIPMLFVTTIISFDLKDKILLGIEYYIALQKIIPKKDLVELEKQILKD